MAWIIWGTFAEEWLLRSERTGDGLDDGDRFICLWIAFNGWMKSAFEESLPDRDLIEKAKKHAALKDVFTRWREANRELQAHLDELSQYTVLNMRYMDDSARDCRYDGTFESLIEVLYQVRCNLFHGRKSVDQDDRDFHLVSLSYKILHPVFKEYLEDQDEMRRTT